MIDIRALNAQLATQDVELRERFASISTAASTDPSMRAMLDLLGEGLAAIHERQGNMITLMLQSGR